MEFTFSASGDRSVFETIISCSGRAPQIQVFFGNLRQGNQNEHEPDYDQYDDDHGDFDDDEEFGSGEAMADQPIEDFEQDEYDDDDISDASDMSDSDEIAMELYSNTDSDDFYDSDFWASFFVHIIHSTLI